LLLSTLATTPCADADEFEALAKTRSVRVVVADDVKGGCWPSPSATKATVEEKLLRAGIPVKPDGELTLMIAAIGFRVTLENGFSSGCVVKSELTAYYFTNALAPNGEPLRGGALVEVVHREGLFTGPNSLQRQIDDAVSGYATEFVVAWLKARQPGGAAGR